MDFLAANLSWAKEAIALATELRKTGLPPLVDRATLPFLFGVSPKLISAMGRLPSRYYRVFSRPKKGGGERQVEAPRRFLKVIQWWINDHILSHHTMPEYVVGFVKGKSIFDNGKAHALGKNLMVVDIKDFFPTVLQGRVEGIFSDMGFGEEVGRQLASLCCLSGRLPQGAPTSPGIANLAFLTADKELDELAGRWNCQYTRYVDDLAFSGDLVFTTEHLGQVCGVLGQQGFAPNYSKSRIVGSGSRQVLTGLVVNSKAHPPRWKRRLWRALFHRVSKHPHEFFERTGSLSGIAAFVNQYDIGLAERYRLVVRQIAELQAGA
jgi:retron-type reverse transcriptase